MSDLGALSQIYSEWNTRLRSLNRWLLRVRKMRDGYIDAGEVAMPDDVRKLLGDVAIALKPSGDKVISAVPLSIRQRLHRKLDAAAGDVGVRLNRLYQKTSLTMDDFDDTLIGDLRTVVAALDDEVTTIYSRMRRFR